MTAALKLYNRHSQAELVALGKEIEADPKNRNTSGGIYLYTAPARRRLSDIDQAITFHLDDSRAAAGRPVNREGYSGRQSRRQR